ncbi:MAG: helix-turn-helix transcriptional regulator [Marinagarivorans sp.]|nr:helix-turn-helix transcriptional regulator [Marinagarivorans sp.]
MTQKTAPKNTQPKNTSPELTPTQKEALLIELTTGLFNGKLSEGEVLKTLRSDYLGMTQETYANLVGISRRSLHEVESNRRALTLTTLHKVFSPLGFKIGLIPQSPHILRAAASGMSEEDGFGSLEFSAHATTSGMKERRD